MSQQYPSLSVALAARPDCVGLRLVYDYATPLKMELATEANGQFVFEPVSIEPGNLDLLQHEILSRKDWQVLECIALFNTITETILANLSTFVRLRRFLYHHPFGIGRKHMAIDGMDNLEELILHEVNVEIRTPLPRVHTFLFNSFRKTAVHKLLKFLNPQVLRQVALRHCELMALPQELLAFENIEHLGLTGNKITEFPVELLQFKKLKYLNLNNNAIARLPAEIMQFEWLEELLLNQNPVTNTTEMKGKSVLWKAIRWCADHHTPPHQRKLFLDLMQENRQATKKAAVEDLMTGLCTDVELIGRKAMNELSKHLPDPFADGFEADKQTISIVGKVKGLSVKEITTQLKKHNIAVNNKLSEKTTVVCIGEKMDSDSVTEISRRQLTVALPHHLKDLLFRLETPYLKESDDDMQENLSRLIVSQDDANVKLAAQMMMTGGIPDELYYQVLLLGLQTGSPHWKHFRTVLERYAPPAHYDFLKKHRKNQQGVVGEVVCSKEFDQAAALKAGLRVFWMSEEIRTNRYANHPFYNYFRIVVGRCFALGGEHAIMALKALTNGNTLSILFGQEYYGAIEIPKEVAVFDEIDTLACSYQSVYPLKHREHIKTMRNLKNLSLYMEPNTPVHEKSLKQSFPKLKITFHNYKM